MTYQFNTINPPGIGFIKANSLEEAWVEAKFRWERPHHLDKDKKWYSVLEGAVVKELDES